MNYIGIDIGSTASKVVLKGDTDLQFVLPTGWSSKETCMTIRERLLEHKVDVLSEDSKVVATGYGRVAVDFADYVIMMGYDEHYAGTDAGSVASLSWVSQGVSDTLKEVPANQLILGMPFYTRVWESPAGTDNQDASDDTGSSKVSSKIYGMKAASDLLNTYGAANEWKADCGQNYAEFKDDSNTYQVWLEDSSSMEARLKLMQENKLAGAAFWKLGFETSDIWDTIIKYM